MSSRVVFHLAGVRFDLRPLDTSWHILDPVLLREELARSLLYTPGQPPLYNLMLGAVLKLSTDPARLAILYRCFYGGMALATCLLLFRLLRTLRVSAWLACAATTLFMLSPALVLYENIPYYEVPVLLLLTLSCTLCHQALAHGQQRSYVWLFLTLAALIWLRSMFQIQWLLTLAVFCLLARPEARRRVLRAALVPTILVLALYGKNLAISGAFATSSWLGMSLVKHTVHQLPMAQRKALVEQGLLSTLALRDTTFDLPRELPAYFEKQPATGVRVLDEPYKSTGHSNYHHLAYVAVSRDALRDSLYVIEHHPALYLRSIGEAFLMFMRPASDYPYLRPNRDHIELWSRAYAHLLAGQPRYPTDPWFKREARTIGYGVLIGYAASVLFGFHQLLRRKLRDGSADDLTLIFMWLHIMYISLVGNALEVGENQRFRFMIVPLLIASSAVLVTRLAAFSAATRLGAPPTALGRAHRQR